MAKNKLIKALSINIEGPFEMSGFFTNQSCFKAELVIVNDRNLQSSPIVRHFPLSTHPLIYKACEKAMEEGGAIRLLVSPRKITLPYGMIHLPSMSNVFKTLTLFDEHPDAIIRIEQEMNEKLFTTLPIY